MTKTDIVELLTRESGLKKKEVQYIIDNFIEKVKDSLYRDERVEIRGFGSFYPLEKKARMVFSPIADKKVDVPAKKTIAFRASKSVETQMTIKGA